MSTLKNLEKTVEKVTGEKADILRTRTIDETRIRLEQKGVKIKFFSAFPFIGRGNVQRDNVLSSSEINKMVDAAIK